jgi:hypothetical protein
MLLSLHPAGSDAKQQSLTAFCATCPEAAEVGRVLEEAGLHLVFWMAADDTATSQHDLATLPAQYHYEDGIGTAVIYLAGKDAPGLANDGQKPVGRVSGRYPAHASRFWLIPGGRELVTRRVSEALSAAFGLRWLDLCQAELGARAA